LEVFLTVDQQMYVALAAYSAYIINALQFLLKLRASRLGEQEIAKIHEGATI
jgi:3-vinyl bacteriochlorophyllide hydratase